MVDLTATRELPAAVPAWRRPAWWRGLVRFCRRKPLGAAGGFIMAAIVVTALFANLLAREEDGAKADARIKQDIAIAL